MVPREVTVAARAAAVMVRVHGPDPKGRKMRNHAFHHSESGDTTLSASGWLLHSGFENLESNTSSVIITCASIVEPFLQRASFLGGTTTLLQGNKMLIPGAEIDVLVEDFEQDQLNGPWKDKAYHHSINSSSWLSAKLVGTVDIPLAGTALQALLDAHGGSLDGAWEIGWALAHMDPSKSQGTNPSSYKGNDQTLLSKGVDSFSITDEEKSSENVAFAMTRVAILSVHSPKRKITSRMGLSEPCKRGDFLLIVGSPFGALSPLHFFNSMVVGITANCWPPVSSQTSLLMADLRCLPGMEGAPTFNKDGAFVGMLARPLRQRGGGAEVQLVITWEALAPPLKEIGIDLQACSFKIPNIVENLPNHREIIQSPSCGVWTHSLDQSGGLSSKGKHLRISSSISKAVTSVVLVTVGDGAWASGVLVNDKGLILTNAHLLEPWRFGKTQISQSQSKMAFSANTFQNDDFKTSKWSTDILVTNSDSVKGFEILPKKEHLPLLVGDVSLQMAGQGDELILYAARDVVVQPALEINYRSYRKIRVRLEHPVPHSWYDARVVYISRGPLDVALLQLDTVPTGLVPIKPEEDCPFPGTTAVVIGHGLFGPRSELCPSLSAGVVSRVVKAGSLGASSEELPAMLETTAAVHPGGSGGAVVNEHGRMIGLVTSNARHSGGAVIPHLNFSIPYAALKPIFSYACGDIKDPSALSAFGKPDEQLSAVWALVPPTPPRTTQLLPFLPGLPNRDGSNSRGGGTEQKGSRFAKFLAETNLEIPKQALDTKEESGKALRKQKESLPSNTGVSGQVFHSRL